MNGYKITVTADSLSVVTKPFYLRKRIMIKNIEEFEMVSKVLSSAIYATSDKITIKFGEDLPEYQLSYIHQLIMKKIIPSPRLYP